MVLHALFELFQKLGISLGFAEDFEKQPRHSEVTRSAVGYDGAYYISNHTK